MTKKLFLPKTKLLIVILSVLFAFCMGAFFVACNENSSDSEETKTYSYTETDTDLISNAKFAYGTHGKTESDFPISSPTGWTNAVDNSATSSLVSSGVISVGETAFDKVFDKLYSDNDFKNVYSNEFKEDVKDKTNDEIKTFFKEKFANPGKYSEDADSYVYMLNNFSGTYEKGTAQRIRSSSTVSVKKGETYKISVWVKTNILNGNGANIRFANTVNGKSQAEFRIDNILADEWTEFTVYFVANSDYDCTFTVMLGMGYGSGKSDIFAKTVEGTVFFDDVTIEKVEELPTYYTDIPFAFGSEEIVSVDPTADNVFKYDMNFDIPQEYLTGIDFYENAELNNESKTIIIKNGDNFNITTDDEAKYALITFKLSSTLNPKGSTDITINVKDIYGDDSETRKVTTYSDSTETDDFVDFTIVVNNNFKNQSRDFYIEIVIGPTDPASVKYNSDFASGKVIIKDVKIAEGVISDTEDDNYKYYSLLSADSDATIALYAGYNADYEQKNSSSNYSLTPAKSNVGQIVNNPTAVDGYYGIVSNHVYIKGQDSDAHLSNEVNDRTAFDGEKGYAGLVNTKYTDNYPEDLNDKLASLYDDDDIQPIVIYNKYLDNYGFIGASQSLSSSAYAKVTVKIRTFDNAKAYIYLVDTSKSEKDVLAFADFTVNTNTGIKNAAINGTLVENKKFMLTVNKNTPVGADNWVEVNFYIATGATAKSFRVEIWNGDRTGETKSTGYVFIDSINVNLSSAFAEPASWSKAFSSDSASNPLYTAMLNGFEFDEIIAYERELTETEKQFNKEYPDQTVSYSANYVWATTSTMVYGIFNTIDPVESDPYDNIQEEEDTGCAANTDPSTFWLSFSSFALAAVLILAIITLFVKRIAERRKANKSDIKTQYKVKSRSESQKAINKVKEQQTKMFTETESADDETETTEDASESVTENEEQQAAENDATEQTEESGDDTEQTGYVYGEVQDFGDMTLENPESEKPAENTEEEKKDE